MEQTETPSLPPLEHEHRRRLLQALASVASDKGYAATTIADIVRDAGVSKRTFYEHFGSKEACFLLLYRTVSASALRTLSDAVKPDRPWQDQLEHALGAYLSHLAFRPALLRTLFVEIHHLGADGAQARREVMQHLADFMLNTVRSANVPFASPMLHGALAMAAVGAINELILERIEQGGASDLAGLSGSASEVVRLLTRVDAR